MLIFFYVIKHISTNMNKILYKLFYVLFVKNKNTNLYCIFYILFIRNQRKN
jgi:hypothetical protein